MSRRPVQVVLVVAVAVLAVLGGLWTTSGRDDAFEQRDRARELNDLRVAERAKLRRRADRLSKLIGLPVEIGKPTATLDQIEDFDKRDYVAETIKESRPVPYGMVGLADGFAFRVVSVKRVKTGLRTWDESDKRKRLPRIKPTRDDIHLVRIELDVINRSGGTGDPACSLVGDPGFFERGRVVMVDADDIRRGVEAGRSAGTYSGTCIRPMPDGGRGRIEVYWGVLGDDARILALDPDFDGEPETNPIALRREDKPLPAGEQPTDLLLLFPKPL